MMIFKIVFLNAKRLKTADGKRKIKVFMMMDFNWLLVQGRKSKKHERALKMLFYPVNNAQFIVIQPEKGVTNKLLNILKLLTNKKK